MSRNEQLFRSQFRKTELCAFHQQAWCSKGERCPFAHGKEELRPIPDLTKTSLCRKWLKFSCRRASAECSFAHGTQELRMTEAYSRRRFGFIGGGGGSGHVRTECMPQANCGLPIGGTGGLADDASGVATMPVPMVPTGAEPTRAPLATAGFDGAVVAGGGGDMQAAPAMYSIGAPQGSLALGGPSPPSWLAGMRFVSFAGGNLPYAVAVPALFHVPVTPPPSLQGRPAPPPLAGDFDHEDINDIAPLAMVALKAALTPGSLGSTDGSSSSSSSRSSNLGSISTSVARAAGLPLDSSEELAEILRGASPEIYED